jgi:hypothetical protein
MPAAAVAVAVAVVVDGDDDGGGGDDVDASYITINNKNNFIRIFGLSFLMNLILVLVYMKTYLL